MEMRGFCATSAICFIAVFALVSASWAGEVKPSKDGKLSGGKFGEIYECSFPNTVKVDGDLNELPWQYAPWHTVEHDDGTTPASGPKDATLSFAALADSEWLYVAIVVTDDKIRTGESVGDSLYQDDSVEIYIDANHARTETYENDDAQITIGASNIDLGNIEEPELGGTGDGAKTGTHAAVVETNDGWVVEAAVPLSNDKWDIEPKNGLVIGFNVHFNDDDDGGDRDHKLIWSLLDMDDHSYDNTTRFGDLKFVNIPMTVEPVDKLSTAWGWIKQH